MIKLMVGQKQQDGIYDGTLSKILALGNYKIKALTVSDSPNSEDSELMGNKVLGYNYDVEKDMLSLHFGINISKKKRSVRLEPDLTLADVNKLKKQSFIKESSTRCYKWFWGFPWHWNSTHYQVQGFDERIISS